MKTHIETIDGKVHVTIGMSKFVLSETTVEIQSEKAVNVKTSSKKRDDDARKLPLPLPSRVRKTLS